MGELFGMAGSREAHVAATEYLILYVLIDAVRRFHASHPGVRVRLSTRTEAEVEATLLRDPDVDLGVAAPYEDDDDGDRGSDGGSRPRCLGRSVDAGPIGDAWPQSRREKPGRTDSANSFRSAITARRGAECGGASLYRFAGWFYGVKYLEVGLQ